MRRHHLVGNRRGRANSIKKPSHCAHCAWPGPILTTGRSFLAIVQPRGEKNSKFSPSLIVSPVFQLVVGLRFRNRSCVQRRCSAACPRRSRRSSRNPTSRQQRGIARMRGCAQMPLPRDRYPAALCAFRSKASIAAKAAFTSGLNSMFSNPSSEYTL